MHKIHIILFFMFYCTVIISIDDIDLIHVPVVRETLAYATYASVIITMWVWLCDKADFLSLSSFVGQM